MCPAARLQRTEAIILRLQDYAEADRILTLLTPGGKRSALAKGIRRLTSRKAGHLEHFYRSQLLLARGRNFAIVTQAESIETFEGLRDDILRYTYACYAGEMMDRFAQEDEENPALYDLMVSGLRWFSREADLRLWMRYFELRMLSLAGFQPELYACVGCQEPIQERPNHFSALHGGLLCAECETVDPSALELSVNAQKVLRYLSTHDANAVRTLRLHESTHAEVESALQHYLHFVLERELRSIAFLQHLRHELQTLEQAGRPDNGH